MSVHPETANERWRRRWSAHVAWSTLAGILLHAAAFLLLPTWQAEEPAGGSPGATSPSPAMQNVRISEEPRSASRPVTPPEPERETERRAEPERAPGPADAPDATRTASFTAPDSRVDARRLDVEPTVATPVPLSRADASGPATGRTVSWRPSEPPLLSEIQAKEVRIVRAAAVVSPPTGWILVRNPGEIQSFMRQAYSRGYMDRGSAGSVSVALEIDEEGGVRSAEITKSSGSVEMDAVALDLFRKVVAFRPARQRGAPIPASATFSLSFPWF